MGFKVYHETVHAVHCQLLLHSASNHYHDVIPDVPFRPGCFVVTSKMRLCCYTFRFLYASAQVVKWCTVKSVINTLCRG